MSSQTNQLNLKIKSEIISHEQHKFAEIMRLDGVSPSDVMDSLSVDKNRHMVFRAGQGAGLSGSFFFFSHDNRFLIKTVKQAEIKILLKMLDKMIDHFRATSNQSLLARVYGVFTIKTNMYAPLSIIVMQNTSMLQSTKHKNMVFDLKGSIANRKVKMGSREFQQMLDTLSHNKVLKDLNYLEINQALNQSVLSLDREQKDALEDLIRRDSMFLREQSLLDYSLLLVIEKVPVGSLPRVEAVSKVLQSDAMTIQQEDSFASDNENFGGTMAPQKATGSQPGLQFDFQSSAHTKRESRNQYFSTHKQSVARRGRQPTDKASHSVEEPRE